MWTSMGLTWARTEHNLGWQGRVHITRDTRMGETRTQLTHFRRPSFSEPPPSAQQQQQQQHADSQPTGEASFNLSIQYNPEEQGAPMESGRQSRWSRWTCSRRWLAVDMQCKTRKSKHQRWSYGWTGSDRCLIPGRWRLSLFQMASVCPGHLS